MKEKRHVPLSLSCQALVWVMVKVNNALMKDGELDVVPHYVRTYLAGECLHVEVVKESGVDRTALDSLLLHSERTAC